LDNQLKKHSIHKTEDELRHKAALLSFLMNLFSANISPTLVQYSYSLAVGYEYTNYEVSAWVEVLIESGGRA
jgi:hypothetical protein